MLIAICIYSDLNHVKLTIIVDCYVLSSPITIVVVSNAYPVTLEFNASSMWSVCGSGPLSDVVTTTKTMFFAVVTVLHVSLTIL